MPSAVAGKRILLGVCGGIAAYKAAELVRELCRRGARVQVVMTAAAQEFVRPLTFQTLSGQPVATELFDLTQESQIGHIHLADSADLVVVAPATANMLAKQACGLADDLLSTILLATRAPVVVAPAMNVNMYNNATVQENLARLQARGVRVVEPAEGSLACGYEGKGRLPETLALVTESERALTKADLAGKRVLVTAGPNREAIDPVRFLSNRSTGKMGFALAAAAWRRGSAVTLIAGPSSLPTPYGVQRLDVVSAEEMRTAVLAEIKRSDILLMTAAVADYRPKEVAAQKLKKGRGDISLALTRTTDILAEVSARKGKRQIVGFAAETESVLEHAQRKLRDKKLDMIVANDVSGRNTGFAVDTNAVTILDRNGGSETTPLLSKDEVADCILDRLIALVSAK